MGLDMYLYKKTYVQNWEHHKPEQKHKISVKLGGKIRRDIKPERITYITEQVAYWRKFNALHNWFIQNCADGKDECQDIYVTEEKLRELLNLLKKVSKILKTAKKKIKVIEGWNNETINVDYFDCEEKINELLPPTSGFFFGSTEIDQYYKDDVENTIKILEEILKEYDETKIEGVYPGDFTYQASW